MKLKKLHINSYLHLKDLEFDFTYPKGHQKEGQPLEKICFIGQSATGKTNILKFIKKIIDRVLTIELDINNEISFFDIYNIDADLEIEINGDFYKVKHESIYINSEKKHISTLPKEYDLFHEKHPIYIIKSDLVSDKNINTINILSDDIIENNEFSIVKNNIDFGFDIERGLWKSLLQDVIDFRKQQLQLASEINIYDNKVEETIEKIMVLI